MFAVLAWDLIYQMILLLRMCTVLHFYKRLSPYVGRLGSSANFQGVTDLLCPHTEVTYIEDVEHLSVCHLQLLSGMCDVISDAGTSSLWSL